MDRIGSHTHTHTGLLLLLLLSLSLSCSPLLCCCPCCHTRASRGGGGPRTEEGPSARGTGRTNGGGTEEPLSPLWYWYWHWYPTTAAATLPLPLLLSASAPSLPVPRGTRGREPLLLLCSLRRLLPEEGRGRGFFQDETDTPLLSSLSPWLPLCSSLPLCPLSSLRGGPCVAPMYISSTQARDRTWSDAVVPCCSLALLLNPCHGRCAAAGASPCLPAAAAAFGGPVCALLPIPVNTSVLLLGPGGLLLLPLLPGRGRRAAPPERGRATLRWRTIWRDDEEARDGRRSPVCRAPSCSALLCPWCGPGLPGGEGLSPGARPLP